MKVTLGLKAHSGWAALVVLGVDGGNFEVVDRRRIELVEENWQKQPYHAAEELEPREAAMLVKRGIQAAHRNALNEIRAAIKRAEKNEHRIVGCAVLMGEPMPNWSVAQILAVHFRMHKAEGVLFREALAKAATKCGLPFLSVPEKQLNDYAVRTLSTPLGLLTKRIAGLGKEIGPPWGKDQKDAALAAMIALGAK
ncbi:MAG TPA: hypothetical protein VGQ39_15215 [Pyrinomonadaceae bacterium]|jgi:hypothetical protein|nr:hypothetical protein [Pyrinomonadaceae bacterium]